MALDFDDLIAAPASAAGPAARAILRISGEGSREAVRTVFLPHDESRWPTARFATRHDGRLRLTDLRVEIPAAAAVWPNRRSYTGQPVVELQLPGSPPLVEATLAALYRAGVRPARPGEFTLRAFLAGRMDLVQAEAVLGVIDAVDHRELDIALRQLAGGLSGRLATVRHDLLTLLADIEAGLDFVDEDIEFVSRDEVLRRISIARQAIDELLADATDRLRDTARPCVVLAGLPNAGKSTLFNALAGHDHALVSPVAGTTRDWLTAELEFDGVPIELVDTAGWERAAHELDVAMQTLRSAQLDRSDLIVWCRAGDASAETLALDDELQSKIASMSDKTFVVMTKSDCVPGTDGDRMAADGNFVSAVTHTGLDELRRRIATELSRDRTGARQMMGSTAARGRQSLESAREALDRSLAAATTGFGDEIIAAELRGALDGLAAVLGAIYTDDVLDVLFSRFCIGK